MSKQLPHVTNWSAHGTVHLKKAPKEIQDHLLNASHIGDEKLEQFSLDRVESVFVNFHDPIKKNKLRTFASVDASPVSVSNNTIALKSDREMFARLLVIQVRHSISMRDVLKFELSVFPPSLATSEGNLNKTVKSKLFQTLQDKIERIHARLATNPNIFDGMVLLQKTPPT